jgi:hypothetical protein
MTPAFNLLRAAGLLAALLLPGLAQAQAMDSIWVLPVEAYLSDALRISAAYPEEVPAGALLPLDFNVESRKHYGGSQAIFRLTGPDGTLVREVGQQVDIVRGPNKINFDLETGGLAEAQYLVEMSVDYGKNHEHATLRIPLRRVTDTGVRAGLASAVQRIAQLDSSSSGDARISLCREVSLQAEADVAGGRWRDAVARLDYLHGALDRVAAGMVFAGQAGPGAVSRPAQPVYLGARGFETPNGPAYPIGLALERPALEGLDRAARLGCQWVTVGVAPEDTLGPEGVSASDGGIRAFLDKAQSLNILVTVRLRPERVGAAQLAQYPFIEAKGFADIAQKDARALYINHIAAVLPIVAGHPAVAAAELIADPFFQFDDESVRQRFIAHVREAYPDRIDLNRQWHSHLADYDEITLQGEFDYSYQNKRPFQYDWQVFHQGVAREYLIWAEAEARRVAPSLPLYITFRGDVFEKGRSRHEPDRELASIQFAATSVGGAVAPSHDIYSFEYPGAVAQAVFARSISQDKPVFMPDLLLGGEGPVRAPAFDFVHTALWDIAMSGVDGVALSEASPLLTEPTALEAILTARSELATWAPIVRAFQQAPAEVGILFSNASKIFDDGAPHLESAQFAFEGASFSGYKVTFLTETDIKAGALNTLPVLIIPDTPALSDETFGLVSEHASSGAAIARTGKPIPYNERGQSRHDVVRNTGNTVLVRGLNLPTEYLHAMDALIDRGALPRIPHAINAYGFPLEGVKTRYIEVDGQPWLYLVNLRKHAVDVHLAGGVQTGRDVLRQAEVRFPRTLEPMQPMLIMLEKQPNSIVVSTEPETAAK